MVPGQNSNLKGGGQVAVIGTVDLEDACAMPVVAQD